LPPVTKTAASTDRYLASGQPADPGQKKTEETKKEDNQPPGADKPGGDVKEAKGIARKIRYSATIQLITEDFPNVESEVARLVKEYGGYIAASEIQVSAGSIRTGFWKARIPVKEFEPFRAAVVKTGEVERNSTDSRDMTEEYYDLESHIKNRQAEEEALRKLMEKAVDKMENFLAVRRELNQVREDIDRTQGRLKLIANLTDLTTVSITVRERQKYVPEKGPEPVEVPTFGRRIGRAFNDSVAALVDLGEGLVVILAALLPWLPLILAIGIPAFIVMRRQLRAAAQLAKEPNRTEPPEPHS